MFTTLMKAENEPNHALERTRASVTDRAPSRTLRASYPCRSAWTLGTEAQAMITMGSVPREEAAQTFSFLAEGYRGRRTSIRELTHGVPEFVFWIYPDGRVHDARTSHRAHPPRGFEHIVEDEPDYGGFLRGRVVRHGDRQLIAVYCRSEALASDTSSLRQFLAGVSQMPIPIEATALVISDNADIYGTVEDLWQRAT